MLLVAVLSCACKRPAQRVPTQSASAGPNTSASASAAVATQPLIPVETRLGCWTDAGRGTPRARLDRLERACTPGQKRLRELAMVSGREVEVRLGDGMHCLRALAAADSEKADPKLVIVSPGGRKVDDAITANVAVVPPRGPLCVQGPARIALRLDAAKLAVVRLFEVPQLADAASQ